MTKAPITSEATCYCGHLKSEHKRTPSGRGECLGQRHGARCTLCRDGFRQSGWLPQEPTVEAREGPGGVKQTVERHPAYGQLTASRVSGGKYLYGSDFRHQHYIQLELYRSELNRDLSHDRPHARERLVSFDMSEAQWAAFVSSIGVGAGVQVTITLDEDGFVPALPEPKDRRVQFNEEMAEHMEKAMDSLDELEAQIAALPVSEKKKTELRSSLRTARANIGSNTEFVAQVFDEHMERTVEKAKSEVAAYAQHVIVERALGTLPEGGASPPLLLDGASVEEAEK